MGVFVDDGGDDGGGGAWTGISETQGNNTIEMIKTLWIVLVSGLADCTDPTVTRWVSPSFGSFLCFGHGIGRLPAILYFPGRRSVPGVEKKIKKKNKNKKRGSHRFLVVSLQVLMLYLLGCSMEY